MSQFPFIKTSEVSLWGLAFVFERFTGSDIPLWRWSKGRPCRGRGLYGLRFVLGGISVSDFCLLILYMWPLIILHWLSLCLIVACLTNRFQKTAFFCFILLLYIYILYIIYIVIFFLPPHRYRFVRHETWDNAPQTPLSPYGFCLLSILRKLTLKIKSKGVLYPFWRVQQLNWAAPAEYWL